MSDYEPSDGPATGPVFTTEDVERLNRTAIERASALARIAGVASIVIAAVVGVAWGWVAVRTQQRANYSVFGRSGGDVDLVERVDLLVNTLSLLVFAVITGAVGVGLRLVSDYMQDRAGGSITGYQPGDDLPVDEDLELVAKLDP